MKKPQNNSNQNGGNKFNNYNGTYKPFNKKTAEIIQKNGQKILKDVISKVGETGTAEHPKNLGYALKFQRIISTPLIVEAFQKMGSFKETVKTSVGDTIILSGFLKYNDQSNPITAIVNWTSKSDKPIANYSTEIHCSNRELLIWLDGLMKGEGNIQKL